MSIIVTTNIYSIYNELCNHSSDDGIRMPKHVKNKIFNRIFESYFIIGATTKFWNCFKT